jgi:hypothetical protein
VRGHFPYRISLTSRRHCYLLTSSRRISVYNRMECLMMTLSWEMSCWILRRDNAECLFDSISLAHQRVRFRLKAQTISLQDKVTISAYPRPKLLEKSSWHISPIPLKPNQLRILTLRQLNLTLSLVRALTIRKRTSLRKRVNSTTYP